MLYMHWHKRRRGMAASTFILLATFGGGSVAAQETNVISPSPGLVEPIAEQRKDSDIVAEPGRKLFAQDAENHILEKARDDAKNIITVYAGHELVEISRNGGWVEVGVARTGKIGWIRVEATTFTWTGANFNLPPTKAFERFKSALAQYNRDTILNGRAILFSQIQDYGDGILYAKAAASWFSASAKEKNDALGKVYNLWRSAEGSGLPIAVFVTDKSGSILVKKSSR